MPQNRWWQVNIGSGNCWLLLGNKPFSEPVLTQIYACGITRAWVNILSFPKPTSRILPSRAAYLSVWSIRYVYRYILVDIRYIMLYFICDYVTKINLCFPGIFISKHLISRYVTRIEYTVVKIINVINSPYKLLNLITCIKISYNPRLPPL